MPKLHSFDILLSDRSKNSVSGCSMTISDSKIEGLYVLLDINLIEDVYQVILIQFVELDLDIKLLCSHFGSSQ